uniref:Protein FAM169B n=1 Tax=Denticeps clupeoides TaxID=299321 RepID=A0AAY4B2D6_9TELE
MESDSNMQLTDGTYPVDLPVNDYNDLSSNPEEHFSYLDKKKLLNLPQNEQMNMNQDNIGLLPLFDDDECTPSLVILHAPGDETQVVAVYLHRKWWSVDEVLKTSSKFRSGLVVVGSIMERIVLFLMSQIVFGFLERTPGEHLYFSPHPMKEFAKIFWQDGEAVGFYTIKKKGTLCNRWTGQSYLLPVLDNVFVRMQWRRKGLALQMLEDFCSSFPKEEVVGLSYPMSASMHEVCRKYLQIHQEQRDRLYEVESPGDWSQRRNVWLKLQLNHHPTNTFGRSSYPERRTLVV